MELPVLGVGTVACCGAGWANRVSIRVVQIISDGAACAWCWHSGLVVVLVGERIGFQSGLFRFWFGFQPIHVGEFNAIGLKVLLSISVQDAIRKWYYGDICICSKEGTQMSIKVDKLTFKSGKSRLSNPTSQEYCG
ncbi:hypothetical protein CUMW_053280 [Citrus unshiu]|nr:hypothetical protein CUMW_053280 [Citrus unshiu]